MRTALLLFGGLTGSFIIISVVRLFSPREEGENVQGGGNV